MQFNEDRVDEVTLALLLLNFFQDGPTIRAWKSFDWETMNRLHEKGFIGNPKSTAKSVIVTREGREEAEKLFSRYFQASIEPSDQTNE